MKKFLAVTALVIGLGIQNFTYAEHETETITTSSSCDNMIGNFRPQQIKEMKAIRAFLMKNKDTIAQKLKPEIPQSVISNKIQDIIDSIDVAFCENSEGKSARGYSEYTYFVEDIKSLVQMFVGVKANEAAFMNNKTDFEANQALLKLQNHLLKLVTLSQPLEGIVQNKENFDLNMSFKDPEEAKTVAIQVKGDTNSVIDYPKNEFGSTIGFDVQAKVTDPVEKTDVQFGLKGNLDVLSMKDLYIRLNDLLPTINVQGTLGENQSLDANMLSTLTTQINALKGKYVHIPMAEETLSAQEIIKAIQTTPVFTFNHQEGSASYGVFNPARCAFSQSEREKNDCHKTYIEQVLGTNGKGRAFLNKKGGQNYEFGATTKYVKADALAEIELEEHLLDTPIIQRNDSAVSRISIPAEKNSKNGLRYANELLDITYNDETSMFSLKGPRTPTKIDLDGSFSFGSLLPDPDGISVEDESNKISGNMGVALEHTNGITKGDIAVNVKQGTMTLFDLVLKASGTINKLTTSPLQKPTNSISGEDVMGVIRGAMNLIDG